MAAWDDYVESKHEFVQDYWRRWFDGEYDRVIPAVPFARIRRGKWGLIPEQWRGKVPYGHRRRRKRAKEASAERAEFLSPAARKHPAMDSEDLDLLAQAESVKL